MSSRGLEPCPYTRSGAGCLVPGCLVVTTLVVVTSLLRPPAWALEPPGSSTIPAAYRPGFESISEREIRAWIAFLASPEVEGRGTGQRGYDIAARYVASVLAGLAVAPGAADGTYFQRFDLYQREGVETARLVIRKGEARPEEIALEERVGIRGIDAVDWERPWVFVGHGEAADADAMDGFLGVDLEDAVTLILPPEGKTRREHLGAQLRGARRIVVISDRRAGERRGIRTRLEPPYRLLEREGVAAGVSVVYIDERAADRIFRHVDRDAPLSVAALRRARRPAAPFVLDGLRIRLEVKVKAKRLQSSNVVGVLPGSDPELETEFVGVGAHLDHMGRRGDDIYFGADDDASGVSAVLAIAKALVTNTSPPRRSVVFMFFGAEELGLHGSRYFADHPPFPLRRMVAELQLDMIGRNEESSSEAAADNVTSIHVIGSKKHSLELDPWVHRLNAFTGLDLEYDMENQVYRRSDHYSFARRGVPVVFFFAGFHPDYHKVTDTPDRLNYEKIVRVSRLVYGLAYEIADRSRRLVRHRF